MFEITYSDNDILDNYIDCGKVHKSAEYDFTFEKRFIIYHAPVRHKIDYIALDMTTGLTSSVITKKPEDLYTRETYDWLIPKILYSVKYTGDTRYVDRFAQEPLETIDYIFRVVLPKNGYNIREAQISLAKKMYIGFTEKQVAICEAEVGTGKTISYLVAAIMAKQHNKTEYSLSLPVTITTSSIELQKAIVEREIPNLSEMLLEYRIIDKPLTAILRKGKEHYFCRYRFEDFLKNISLYPQKYGETIETLRAMSSLRAGVDLDCYRISGAIKNRICVKGTCFGCKKKGCCEYDEFINMMDEIPDLVFQVTNHNLYLMSQKMQSDEHPFLLRESCFVVVDEAHKFKEAAETTFGEQLSEKDIDRYVNGIQFLCSKKDNPTRYKELIKALREENSALFKSLRKMRDENDLDEDRSSLISPSAYQISKLNKLLSLIGGIEKMKIKRNYGIPVTGDSLITAIRAFKKYSENAIWIDTDENDVLTLCCTPRNINDILNKTVWNRCVSHVLTSGTLSDGSDFEFFKAENGLSQIQQHLLLETKCESPFDYKHHTRLYIPKGMPYPDNSEEYIWKIAEKIYEIIKATNGHTAILFTSYKTLSLVYELLADDLEGYDTICMTKSNKTAITDFKKSKNGILFASGSMWEGVDCIGDCLSSVIIVRLPFPMRSALMEDKRDSCPNLSDFVDRYCTPNMLIRLRQGVGRLIRCEDDTGVISILDPRAACDSYAEKISQALRKFPRVRNTTELHEFMKKVKNEDYFSTGEKDQ